MKKIRPVLQTNTERAKNSDCYKQSSESLFYGRDYPFGLAEDILRVIWLKIHRTSF